MHKKTTISPGSITLLVTRLYSRHVMVRRLYVHMVSVVILTPEKVGSVVVVVVV